MRLRRLLLATVALVPLVASCGEGDAAACAGGRGSVTDDVVTCDEDRRLTIDVTGARTVHFEGVVAMHFLLREGDGGDLTYSAASITLEQPLLVDGTLVNPELGLVGMYDGDGSYTLPAGLGQEFAPPHGPKAEAPASSGTTAISVAGITFGTSKPGADELRYGHLLKACEVELRDAAGEGKGRCPALVAVDGTQVSMSLRWSAP